jgi:anti-sigma factor RsiW
MCDEREKLIGYLYDEVDANERRDVEMHLSNCETCREELSAFRNVRQDLLAFDVPPHESVWKPFVTAQPQPVWRQVPAWSLAAAAAIVFAVGGAGGFAGRALAARSEAPVQVATMPVAQPTAQPVASLDDLRAIQTRLAELERAATGRGVSTAPVAMAASSDAASLARVEELISDSEGRVTRGTTQRIIGIIEELGRQRKADNAMLLQQIADTQELINSNILRAMSTRGAEKEKEQ